MSTVFLCVSGKKRQVLQPVVHHVPECFRRDCAARQRINQCVDFLPRGRDIRNLRACEKRPVALAKLEEATDAIEQIIQNSLDREVSTTQIGELVMERLKPLDEVAYVRFASVYRQFKDIDSFMHELNKLLDEK